MKSPNSKNYSKSKAARSDRSPSAPRPLPKCSIRTRLSRKNARTSRDFKRNCRKSYATPEIEISIERAKIARERVEIDEQMRVLGRDNTNDASAENGQSQGPDKPARGRWLSRLGLKDLDEDDG